MALKEADARQAAIDELILGKLGGGKKEGPGIDVEALSKISNEIYYT